MNQNLTHREFVRQMAGGTPAVPGRAGAVPGAPEPLVQTSEPTRERLAREILNVSGPMMNPARHHHWLLTLEVHVLQQRLKILIEEK